MSESDAGAALLALSPGEVFASRGVAEVLELNKKIQYEIERKREDLRAMVGERYRDLIHAADTIQEMRGTTESTLQHMDATVALCRNLHDAHLLGFRIQEKTSFTDRNNFNLGAHGVAVQMKLLLDIPEKIWTCIESEDYLRASQLFILARHINTGLQLQAGSKSLQSAILPLQPLIERQWSSISNFHGIIEKASRDKLQDVDLREEVACSCLLSLYLLEPQTSLLQLLRTFIGLHSDRSLERTLHLRLSRDSSVREEIGGRIVDSAKLVLKTIELVQTCFVDKDGGSIVSKLTELYKRDSAPLIDLVHFQDTNALKLLPPVISSYRLTASKQMEPLSIEEVSDSVSTWIKSVQIFIQQRVQLLLQNINNAKTLHHIREEALKIKTPSNWSEICSSLSVPQIDVWSQYFQPLLTARVKNIIDSKWGAVLETFKSQMLTDLARVSREDSEEKEADLNWFVWRDLIGDTVIESRDQVVHVMNTLMKGMWLQDRGYTPTLEKLCRGIDAELLKLLQDLAHYLYDKRGRSGTLAAFELEEDDTIKDREEIEVYLRDVSGRNIASMLEFIKEECLENATLQTTELQCKTTAVYTARFVQSLTHLMPNLRSCYVHERDYDTYERERDGDGENAWRELCGRLKESSQRCWGKWVDIAVDKVVSLTEGLPREFTVEANLDFLLMQWDVIKIEEKDDDEKPIESTIKIPSGPSLKLQEYLYSVSRILDEVVPHTLPRDVHVSFVERIVDITLSHYGNAVREKETDINQKCALQLLMDVRHMTLLLVPRENKRASEASHDICELLRRMIDPFDYDVFYPYIQTNVKRSVQRVQTMLGSIMVNAEQTASVVGSRVLTSGGTADKAPALLASAPEPGHWFTLLPVTAPQPMPKKEKTRKKARAGPGRSSADASDAMSSSLSGINLASAKSGAAAFFGSMTGDWFSGS